MQSFIRDIVLSLSLSMVCFLPWFSSYTIESNPLKLILDNAHGNTVKEAG